MKTLFKLLDSSLNVIWFLLYVFGFVSMLILWL